MTFRPIDPTKPIVLAVDNMTSIGFVYIDHHLKEGAEAGMRNYDMHKTDEFLIDCQRHNTIDGSRVYWSVTSGGITFVYGKKTFPETWMIRDCDQLCAFVAGELTVNQLRKHAYLADREVVKEERREAHIQRLTHDLSRANNRYEQLVSKLKSTMSGVIPFIGKANVLKVIKNNS
jgi:hypothetical protein